MFEQLISDIFDFGKSLIPVAPVIYAQIKQYKTQKRESKAMIEGVREVSAQNTNYREREDLRDKKDKFDKELTSTLEGTRSIIIVSSDVPEMHKSMMRSWGKYIEELAFSYYYNQHRGVAYKIKDFLDVEIGNIETVIKAFIKHDLNESKIVKYKMDGEPITSNFFEWVTDTQNRKPFARMEVLKISLMHNGFDNPENEDSPNFIETIDENLKLILEGYRDLYYDWRKIKTPIKPSKKVDYTDQ